MGWCIYSWIKKGYFKCYDEALREVGAYLKASEKRQRILSKWGRSHNEVLSELLKGKPELIDTACKVYEQHLFGDTFIEQLSLIPGSKELLIRLSKKYALAIATGIHPKILKDKVFSRFNIPQVFTQHECCVTSLWYRNIYDVLRMNNTVFKYSPKILINSTLIIHTKFNNIFLFWLVFRYNPAIKKTLSFHDPIIYFLILKNRTFDASN